MIKFSNSSLALREILRKFVAEFSALSH
uniref:Uncharacterized protein n=1 Tax=Rhizophora mucronata TaxID=61149 RepID=A0A2P2N562_RHIMU